MMLDVDAEEKIRARIDWLKQKERAQREVGGPEYTASQLLWGRTQGNIGALEWVLREAGLKS